MRTAQNLTGPAVDVANVDRTGRVEPGRQGQLARDYHRVTLNVPGAGEFTVENVGVPEVFYHRVHARPTDVLPFVFIKLAATASRDRESIMEVARRADRAIGQLPMELQEDIPGIADRAARFTDETAADRHTAKALVRLFPTYVGLKRYATIAIAFGYTDAKACKLLEQVHFAVTTTKTADSYGDSSYAHVVASRNGRRVEYEIRGGVMALGSFQAASYLHTAIQQPDGRMVAERLFDADELATLAGFDWYYGR